MNTQPYGSYTEEEVARKKAIMVADFATYKLLPKACAEAGIHRSTYYDWRNADEQFAADMDMALQRAKGWARKNLVDAAALPGAHHSLIRAVEERFNPEDSPQSNTVVSINQYHSALPPPVYPHELEARRAAAIEAFSVRELQEDT